MAHVLPERLSPEEVRRALYAALFGRAEIDFAYLFGSFLDGPGYHDVDVGLFLFTELSKRETFDYEMDLSVELTLALHVEVDIHVLNGAPMGFQHSAISGELLFARDHDRLTDFIEHIGWEMMQFSHHAEDYLREVLG
jgi:predicted nucleotidyltransferase